MKTDRKKKISYMDEQPRYKDMEIPEEYDYMGVDWENLQAEDPVETAKDLGLYVFLLLLSL